MTHFIPTCRSTTTTQTPDPTTTHNPFKHRSQPKKKPQPLLTHAVTHDPNTGPNHDPQPLLSSGHSQKPQPPLTHAVTHDPNIGPITQPRPKHWTHNPNTGPNRAGRERRDGVWVRREERAKMEKQRREGRERKELKLERKNWRGIKYIYIFF